MIKSYEKVLSPQNAILHQVTAPTALRAVLMSAEINNIIIIGNVLLNGLAGLLYGLQKALERSVLQRHRRFDKAQYYQNHFDPIRLQAHLSGFAQIMDCRFELPYPLHAHKGH